MIQNHKTIKVIKKAKAAGETKEVIVQKASKVAAREMVSTVTGWVTDLKRAKSGETMAAIERLFGTNPRPSES